MENTTLEITNVKIYTLENNDSKLRAFAHIVINNALKITGLKVIEGKNGLFAAFPDRKDRDGNFMSLVRPLSKEIHQKIQEEVIHSYQTAISA